MPEHPSRPKPSGKSSGRDTHTPSHCREDGTEGTSTHTCLSLPSPSSTTEPSASPASPTAPNLRRPRDVEIATIVVDDPKNARLDTDPDHVASLAAEISAHGLLHPITLCVIGDQRHLVAGNNRLLAAKSLGWTTISATTVPNDPTTVTMIRLAENLHRQTLSPIEEACQLAELVEAHPLAVDGAVQVTNRSIEWVLGRLDLLQWPPPLQEAVHHGRISMAAAKQLHRIQPDDVRDRYIRNAIDHGCNAATATLWVQQAASTPLADFEVPELSAESFPKSQTHSQTVICKLCDRELPVAHVTVLHVCAACNHELGKSVAEPARRKPQTEPTIEVTQQQLIHMINDGVAKVLENPTDLTAPPGQPATET